MGAKYKLTNGDAVLNTETKAFIYPHSESQEWQEYQTWLSGGNSPDPVYTRDQVLAQKISAVNATTDVLIATGFVYPDADGQPVRLLEVDQHNFEGEKNMYAELAWDGADVSGYFPVQVKVNKTASGAPVFLTINSLDEYKTFVRAGKMYIRQCLADGWQIKADLQTKTLEELTSWVDPRL